MFSLIIETERLFMRQYNIQEAKTHLSSLIDGATRGNPFIIAKAGKPMVKVVPISPEKKPTTRKIGFMAGEISIPEDFDSMGKNEIEKLFYGGDR
jgi:prevent-host-death family protein